MARIDVVTIFPEFFTPLDLSLIGKAREQGILQINVHDLRDWATGTHRSVDATPAGGGAGMVMRPDVWGKALDDVVEQDSIVIIPTPGGQPFTQRLAQEFAEGLAQNTQIVIACGRYEGIDARVSEFYAQRTRVEEISIGDYVLNGGETAALAMIEAITRLVPGVVGNPESLVEESHGQEGLLEYPVYTTPHSWRGAEVPPVLKSGDHAKIAAWRKEQSLARTARVRPELLDNKPVEVRAGRPSDAPRLHTVAQHTFPLACPPGFPRHQALAFVAENLSEAVFRRWAKQRHIQLWVAKMVGVIVGYAVVERKQNQETALLSKFYVLQEHHGTGAATALMDHTLREAARVGISTLSLGVNRENERAQRFYQRYGFTVVGQREFNVGGTIHNDFVMERTLDFASGV